MNQYHLSSLLLSGNDFILWLTCVFWICFSLSVESIFDFLIVEFWSRVLTLKLICPSCCLEFSSFLISFDKFNSNQQSAATTSFRNHFLCSLMRTSNLLLMRTCGGNRRKLIGLGPRKWLQNMISYVLWFSLCFTAN